MSTYPTGPGVNASVHDKMAPPKNAETTDLMTVDDVAIQLGVSRAVVRSLFRSGAIRAFKVGGQWRARPGAIPEYLIQQMRKNR